MDADLGRGLQGTAHPGHARAEAGLDPGSRRRTRRTPARHVRARARLARRARRDRAARGAAALRAERVRVARARAAPLSAVACLSTVGPPAVLARPQRDAEPAARARARV